MPDFQSSRPLQAAAQMWLARLYALLSGAEYDAEAASIRMLTSKIGDYASNSDVHQIQTILYRVLAITELQTPAPMQGSFIPVGNAFDALVAVGSILKLATTELLIVDPYLDEKVLTDFALQIAEGVSIRLLTDQKDHKPTLLPAARRWATQYKTTRPLSVRVTPPRMLHDRLIVIDNSEVRVLTQSLNAFALRSPASIIRVDDETSALKIPAYQAIWDAATPL